ncbi:nucleolar and spindle-associated protein 1-like [Dendronephthya gigantea]|uniref:nucleolar and spindle-associated protein 1-like n=1 Tax=Dendronephthya gigantea TaxID=151771 RepID=UPI00106CFB15|nr:nucleolar and spindle-associated protein 1-like [Dendronephthya gigantea]
MDYTIDELHAMKRIDLQKLCKQFGIKANIKTEKMVEELSKHSKPRNLQNEQSNSIRPSDETVLKEPDIAEGIKDDQSEVEETQNIRKKEEKETRATKRKSGRKVKAPSKIPRRHEKKNENIKFECNTPKTNENGKSKTPKNNAPKDWTKIHQRQFDKMDSLDVYLTKKRKRAEDLSCSAKKVNLVSAEEKSTTENKVIQRPKPQPTKPTPVNKPKIEVVVTPKPEAETLANKKRLTFNFFPSTKENPIRTPRAGKRRTTLTDTEPRQATPFRLTTNTMPFGSPTPRKKFDLQASLAKPLRYKPYTGKLPTPPYAKNSPKIVSVKKANAPKTHQRDIKAVKTKTRKDRRMQQMKSQSRARESAVSRRRGLMN